MNELLDPKNDFLFKRIFGSEENKDVLLAFLNRTFTHAGKPPLCEIILLNSYTDKDSPLDKQSIFDIHARTADSQLINIEMQLFNNYDMEKRTLYYWSKLYSSQLFEGNAYKQLRKCVTINVLDYSFLPNEQYHNVFRLSEDASGIHLTDDMELHFLELPKLGGSTLADQQGGLMNWLLFLKYTDSVNWEELAMNEPQLKKAMNTLEFLSQDQQARMEYESRQKALRDEISRQEYARDRGLEEGRKEGIQQGIEQGIEQTKLDTARKMLAMGLPADIIAEATGLSQQQIQDLRAQGESPTSS
ncbi:Rpn family recombination-promoting nuclease/putative transposase [Paenibacillus kandeliae]|uniref:Rpn family recombination-promoting nuclease/putative transposase n=1 Tax=Paenibacillus kandeliae TaxID=3231269 RepID=UPI00345AC7F6